MQHGFSLFEVLISLFILSIVLFSFAQIELNAFKSVREVHHAFLKHYQDQDNHA